MGHPMIFLIILLLANIVTSATAFTAEESEVDIIEKILQDYNPDARPRPVNATKESDPTHVTVSFYVREVDYLDDNKMEYSVQLTFRQQWNDARLKFNPPALGRKYVSLKDSKRIWLPDTFFTNEKSGHVHELLTPNMYIRVFPDGEVIYSIRVSLVLACPMNFRLFPFENQHCSIRMASYGYTTEDIVYKWSKNDPIQISPALNIPRYSLDRFDTDYCDSLSNMGVYSCLRADFKFRRQLSYYLVQIFIPTTSLVIMTWLSFWLSPIEVVGRLLLTLTTYLANMIALVILNFTLPRSSVTKAIDTWTGICLTFVSVGIWELILIQFINRKAKKELNVGKTYFEISPVSQKIDYYFRIIYPILFVLFAGVFTSVYICNRDKFGETGPE